MTSDLGPIIVGDARNEIAFAKYAGSSCSQYSGLGLGVAHRDRRGGSVLVFYAAHFCRCARASRGRRRLDTDDLGCPITPPTCRGSG